MNNILNEFLPNVSRGLVLGSKPIAVSGKKITTAADSGVLWSGGAFMFPSSSGVQMSIVSTMVNDASGGTGIRTIDVHYLDATLNPLVETVTMNGTTAVLTVATNIRFIQKVVLKTVGSLGVADGNISITNSGNGHSFIKSGDIKSDLLVFMIPIDKRLLVTGINISSVDVGNSLIELSTTFYEGVDYTSSNIMIPILSATNQNSASYQHFECPLVFTEGQSVGFKFSTDGVADISANLVGWLEDV